MHLKTTPTVGFAGRGRSGRPEKDVLFLLVFVHHQEFLLFRVEETDNVVQILSMVHEKRNLPRRRGIDDVDFLAAGIVRQFVVGRHVKLAPSVERTEDDFVAQDDRISSGTQFVKWQNVEPRVFVAGRVQQFSLRYLLDFRCSS